MADPIIIHVEEEVIVLKESQGMPGRDGKDPVWGNITGNVSDQTDLGAMAQAPDAPSDGKPYARQDGDWVEVQGGGSSDIPCTVSGFILSISDAVPADVLGMTVKVEPAQSGTGTPSAQNIRPISGWAQAKVTRYGKNLFDKSKVTAGAYLNRSKGLTSNNSYGYAYVRVPVGSTVVYSGLKGANGSPCGIQFLNAEKQYIGEPPSDDSQKNGNAVTIPAGTVYIGISVFIGNNVNYKDIDTAQLEFGTVATDYEDYTPTEVTVDLGSTIYGGILDVTAGTLSVTDGYIASYAGEELPGTWISDRDAYAVGTSPTTGAQVVYKLAEPVTVQLTPDTLNLLLGDNVIWADCGDLSLTYKADAKKYIDGQVNALKLILTTYVEDEMKASQNYTSGSVVIVGNTFLKLTANVAAGSALIVGSNCVGTTMADWIKSIV